LEESLKLIVMKVQLLSPSFWRVNRRTKLLWRS